MPRNACVIQITPVRLTRTSANDASVVRKIYLSIDPIVTARSHPPGAPERRLATNPGKPGSPMVAPPAFQPSTSLYHPFDPSTKWPRHGTLGIWVIIRPMWPPGHGGAWQCGGSQAIVLQIGGPDQSGPPATRMIRLVWARSGSSKTALNSGGFTYVRRRQ